MITRRDLLFVPGYCSLISIVGCSGIGIIGASSNLADAPQHRKSSRGTFYVRCGASRHPIPTNESFNLLVSIHESADLVAAAGAVTVAVDARMPSHDHGMNVQPIVVPAGEGSFRVEGVLLHMPGDWEVYVYVTRDGVTERAVFRATLA